MLKWESRWATIASCGLACLFSGCSTIGAGDIGASVPPVARTAETAPAAKPLLFVGSSTAGTIDAFAVRNGKYALEYQIHDDNGPEGLHTDATGNLYVADEGIGTEGPGAGDIDVYAPGAASPFREIFAGYNVSDVVAAPNGALYASNFGPDGYFGPGSLSIYKPNSDSPKSTIVIPNAFQALSVVRDPSSHDEFVSYSDNNNGGHIARFAPGSGPKDLGVSYSSPWGIAEDAQGNLLVAADTKIQIYSQNGKSVGSFAVPGIAYRLAFNTDRSLLYVTTFDNFDVEIFSYPKGKMIGSITSGGWSKSAWPDGVAFWPPPK